MATKRYKKRKKDMQEKTVANQPKDPIEIIEDPKETTPVGK
jgi:hypothetical protein